MKKQLLPMLLLSVSLAQANTVESSFQIHSELPSELRVKVLETIKSQCGNLISAYGLREIRTDVRVDRVDQGIRDYYYETTLSSRYYFDGMHPTYTTITVESAHYDVINGEPFAVISVESPDNCETY